MPDATVLLSEDHKAVSALFSKVEGQRHPDPATVDKIVKELSIHDAIEKEYLYPLVTDKLAGGAGLASHSLEEHSAVAETLNDIDTSPADSPNRAGLLVRLIALVRTHVHEEETKIFPAMRTTMTPLQLDKLGDSLLKAKATAPTRPHPHAPNSGVGAHVAGTVAAPIDKARDKIAGRG